MPRRRGIFRRAIRWLRNRHFSHREGETQRLPEENRHSSPEEDESQRLSQDNEPSLSEEEEETQSQADERLASLGVIFSNRWIQSQRGRPENQRLQATNEHDPSRLDGPIVQTFSLVEVPQPVQRISRSLTLVIVENGRRFRCEIIEVDSQFLIWTVTGYYPGWY
ncbi:hypothetical protein BDR22DRAFT_10428 [Usnea florida]